MRTWFPGRWPSARAWLPARQPRCSATSSRANHRNWKRRTATSPATARRWTCLCRCTPFCIACCCRRSGGRGGVKRLVAPLPDHVGQVFLAQHPPLPVLNEGHDVRQQTDRVVGRQDGNAQQIAEADQDEQVLAVGPLTAQRPNHLIISHAEDEAAPPLADGLPAPAEAFHETGGFKRVR